MKTTTLFILLLTLLFSSCEMKKFTGTVNRDDSSSEVSDIDSAGPDDLNDVESEPDSDETQDFDIDNPDDDLPCGSVYFNGIDSYISVEHNDALNLGKTWTIEAWVMQDDLSGQNPIVRKGDDTESPSYWLYGKTPDPIDESFSNVPSGGYQYGASSAEYNSLHSLNDVKNGKWYHIALVKSETQLKLFINGVLQVSENTDEQVFKSDQNLYFGARLSQNKVYFYGLIDEIRFSYTTRYLENFEPKTRLSADPDTIAAWHFDEISGYETQSDGKNVLTGVLIGSSKFVNECADSDNTCENQCFFAGEETCSDGIFRKCVKNENGCYVSQQEECATGLCANPTSCAVGNCPFAGMTECVSGSARICRKLGNGILDWSKSVKCSDEVCADDYSCLSCSDECELEGQTTCSDGKISACVKNGCLKWDTQTNCSLNECENSTNCKTDGWIDISGGTYKCGINAGGELYCWRDSLYPEKMSTRTNWNKVAVSSNDPLSSHFCAIASGELHCMGYNANGELGDGTNVSKNALTRVGSRSDWSDISTYFFISNGTDSSATCGLAGGELFCWGTGILSPKKMGTKTDWEKITGNCGIASGRIFCWSSLSSEPEQVGDREDWDNTTSYLYLEDNKYYCAISSGELFCWGNNDYGQLGNGTFESRSDPVKIGSRNDWEKIIGGYNFTCGVASGELFCWGLNIGGMLGENSVESVNVPTKMSVLNNWKHLSPMLCAIESNDIYCLKDISENRLTKVSNLNKWTQISTAKQKRCGISERTLYCSDYSVDSGTYTEFLRITDNSDWDSVSTGNYHSCAIRNEDLYCWGNNNSGQIGDSTNEYRENPVQIGLDRKWESVSCGSSYTCGTSGGQLYCWGNNYESDSPKQIGNKTEWEKISAGDSHTCGIESGELYCWGDNNYGQVGTGTTETVYEPVKIGNRSDWEQVVSGDSSTCGIAGGELFCWGEITNYLTGKLQSIPAKIGSYNDFKQIGVPGNLLCGLRSDNHLYCFSQISIASGYNATDYYPEKVAEIKWNSLSESGRICGINDKKELYCSFAGQSFVSLQMLINP